MDTHDAEAFAPIRSLTVGEFRNWLLSDNATPERTRCPYARPYPGDGRRREQAHARAGSHRGRAKNPRRHALPHDCGLERQTERASAAQPPHRRRPSGLPPPFSTDYSSAPAMRLSASIPPATTWPSPTLLLRMIDSLRQRFQIPVQSCVLAHITTQLDALRAGAPVDLLFQSIAGTEAANRSFGVNLALLAEAHDAGQQLKRGGPAPMAASATTLCTSRPARAPRSLRTPTMA